MELMNSVLLCALFASLPQALGRSRRKPLHFENGFSDSILIQKKLSSIGKNIVLHMKSPSQNKLNDLQSTFMNPICKECNACIEKAITDHKSHMHGNFQDNLNIDLRRDKRTANKPNLKKSKKTKPNKNKNVSIIKYDDEGKVYALKVTETIPVLNTYKNNETVTTCQVYSVKKAVLCDSVEANIIMSAPKKKVNKKGKKGHDKRDTKTAEMKTVAPINTKPEKTGFIATVYMKRNADDSQIAEQIMPSIEEMY